MRSLAVGAALLLALAVTPRAMAAQPPLKPAPAKADWTATATRTPEGAIVIGNPAARVKIVEYLSMTCSHCAELSVETMAPLQRGYIASGAVSLEVRHAVRDDFDFVASLLLRCEPGARYLDSIEALFVAQEDWMARGAGIDYISGYASKPVGEKFQLIASAAGFDTFFAKRGMAPAAYAACLVSEPGKRQLVAMAGNSWQRDKIPGTPMILLNGKRQDGVLHWAQLEALIKAALK